MKLERGETEMKMGFQNVAAGTYNWEVAEGISKFFNENSGKTSIYLPLVCDGVIKGDSEAVGKSAAHFIPIETDFGETQLLTILTCTDLVEPFLKKMGDNVDPVSDDFINNLKIKLTGKYLEMDHELSINQNTKKERMNFTRIAKVGTTKGGAAAATDDAKTAGSGDADW